MEGNPKLLIPTSQPPALLSNGPHVNCTYVCVTEVWIVFPMVVVVVVVVRSPRRTAVDGYQRQRPNSGGWDLYKELFWWNYGEK